MLYSMFKNKTVNFEKLRDFGFVQKVNLYTYSASIVNGQFNLIIDISQNGDLRTKVIDVDSEEEYILHQIADAVGGFVGKVRTDCQEILQKIADKCFDNNVFKSKFSAQVIEYIGKKYNDKLEFLWEKFSDNAIFRRNDNKKWYAVLLVLSRRKLGLDSDDVADVIDLRIEPCELEKLVDNKKYFPGYHMNKKHWITICLDGSVSLEEIYNRIDTSYSLAKK